MKNEVSDKAAGCKKVEEIAKKLSVEELELLNLIAEMAVQAILKDTNDECNRLHQD